MRSETDFKHELIGDIKRMFEGAIVLKNDPTCIQGIPDITIFYKNKYAMLETKKFKNAAHQPNQDYYIKHFNGVAFAAFVYPENKEEVLHELSKYLLA